MRERESPPLPGCTNGVKPAKNHFGFWLPHYLDADDEDIYLSRSSVGAESVLIGLRKLSSGKKM